MSSDISCQSRADNVCQTRRSSRGPAVQIRWLVCRQSCVGRVVYSRAMRIRISIALVFALSAGTGAQTDALSHLRFLVGDWRAVDTPAGETGAFTFKLAVQDHVIVRTNEARYAATAAPPPPPIVCLWGTAGAAGEPRYRLTSRGAAQGALDVSFEIAPPGSPDALKPY